MLGIKLPSGNHSRTASQEGSKRILYSLRQKGKEPKIQQSCLNFLYLVSLNWSKLINVLDVGLITLSAFSIELLCDSELSDNAELLQNYFNPALFVAMVNNDDNSTLTDAMNEPDSAGFMVAMEEKKNRTLIQMQVFTVVDKEPWMKVVSSI